MKALVGMVGIMTLLSASVAAAWTGNDATEECRQAGKGSVRIRVASSRDGVVPHPFLARWTSTSGDSVAWVSGDSCSWVPGPDESAGESDSSPRSPKNDRSQNRPSRGGRRRTTSSPSSSLEPQSLEELTIEVRALREEMRRLRELLEKRTSRDEKSMIH